LNVKKGRNAVEYYVSKVHNKLNRRRFSPETITTRLCLNPKYNVELVRPADEMKIFLDSGAFQDLRNEDRISFEGALSRQLTFEKKVGFESSYIVSYDRIVDESPTIQGKRKKRRVGPKTADRYVDETINAAKYLADQREELRPRKLVLSNQGVHPKQYIECVKEVLSFAEPGDVLGMGGFCIIGQVPHFAEDFFEVLESILPLMKKRQVKRLHVFGVGVFKVLIRAQVLCHKHGVIPSYDTASLELNAVFGKSFTPDVNDIGPRGVHLTQVFARRDKYKLYHPRDWAILNIRTVNFFWDRLNELYPVSEAEDD
jgi:queuine/archaeosine tRNA-ribosyltransferase